jgi:hypothetical protein
MRFSAVLSFSALATITLLTGCALTNTATPGTSVGPLLKGNVHGGQQPVTGANIYLLAAGTSGYGGAATSLITPGTAAGSDPLGNYVTTDSSGNFSITGDYTCASGTQVYLLAIGGNPGLTGNQTNPNLALMAALGQCPASGNLATQFPYISVNEVTTVASVYALSGFMTDLAHVSSSGSTLSNTGMANAFANVNNLVDIPSGTALATTPAGNGTVPQAEINTLANILAACVNSTGAASTTCSTLFSTAVNGGTQPTDTVTAALNIAQNPGTGTAALYALAATTPPFAPALATQPNDFTIALTFTGGGLSSPDSIAIDASGNVWAANYCGGLNPSCAGITELSSTGAAISPAAGYGGGGIAGPQYVAIDQSGNIWTPNFGGGLVELNGFTGTPLSGSSGYFGGGLNTPYQAAIDASGNVWGINAPSYGHGSQVSEINGSTGVAISSSGGYTGGGLNLTSGIAIDASGYVWVANEGGNSVSRLQVSNGAAVSGSAGYTGGGLSDSPISIAIDGSGNVWTGNYHNSVSKLDSTGAPVSGSSGYTGGGLNTPFAIAIDGLGNAWTANNGNNTITTINGSTGGATGYTSSTLNDPLGIAIDGSGNAWVANNNDVTITEFIGVAAPVVTPISAGVAHNTLGARP